MFLGTILNVYFVLLKVRKKIRTLAQSGRHKIIAWLNLYVYKLTIVSIVVGTLLFNLVGTTLSAEELNSKLLFATIVGNSTEQTQLIEEGPLSGSFAQRAVSYLDSETVLSDDLIEVPLAPDTDDDDVYATTEGDSAIIAPIITDPGAASPNRRDKIDTYIVQNGDTLGNISQRFGVNMNTLLWQNNLSAYSTIRPGQALAILPVDGVAHTVKAGETVSAIAKRYQVLPGAIISQNKLADASDIHINEVLIIPDGIKPTAVAVRPRETRPLPTVLKDVFIPPSAGPGQDTGTKLLWPILSKRITQYFTLRHKGLDIGDKRGNPIYAAESGRVERAGWNSGGYGYYVILNHGNGVETLYAHSSKLLVKAGDSVARGDTIALIGSTGRSTGPHLHFEVRVNGRVNNPLNFVR